MSWDGIAGQIGRLFDERGGSMYGGEGVTQLEHALQAATLAETSGADSATIVAALLHDIGHLLHNLPDDAPDAGIDDVHERLAYEWLRQYFPPEVAEPVRMHVDAKRYLCGVEPAYQQTLSPPSVQSLMLQGGPYTPAESREFEQNSHFSAAVQVRRWDDLAKVPGFETSSLDHFLVYVAEQAEIDSPSEVGS